MEVLRQLFQEEFLSGEAIAQRLGCSRASVHNAVREAHDMGIVVHAVKGRGYRLAESISWLDPVRLEQELVLKEIQFHYFEHVGSTNTFLLEQAGAGAPHRTVAVAELQSEGRGRRGRSWLTGLGDGLAFSFLWRSGRPAAELSGLSLAVGAILVEALRRMGLTQARVKWPNDIVVEGKSTPKLAGVLIELSGDMLGPSTAVIGLGINFRGGEILSRTLGQPVTDLSTYLGQLDRNEVFLFLLAALDEGLGRFEREGFAAFHAQWDACHAHRGRDVSVLTGQGESISGQALGVDAYGALLMQTPEGMRRFHSGEVSLRGEER